MKTFDIPSSFSCDYYCNIFMATAHQLKITNLLNHLFSTMLKFSCVKIMLKHNLSKIQSKTCVYLLKITPATIFKLK